MRNNRKKSVNESKEMNRCRERKERMSLLNEAMQEEEVQLGLIKTK